MIIVILVMGWWKMIISHLKHSYLNWRVIPCKRKKMIRVYAIFHHFSTFFYSCLDLIEFSSAWHDNQFLFFIFLLSFSRSHGLFTSGNDACHRWPSKSKHLFSCENCFERLVFWSKVVYIISIQREDHGSKVFQKNGQFWSTCPRHQSRWFQNITILGLVFLVFAKVWQVWSCSKSWCIPNYQLSVSFKNSSFFVAWFSKNLRESFHVRDSMASCLSRHDQKVYSIFQKLCPLGHHALFFIQMIP